MGYWENTAYVAAESKRVIVALEEAICEEGMRRIPRPPSRTRRHYEPLQYENAFSNNMWVLAVFPGAPGWTAIKTAPLELLAERAEHASKSRFVALCERLGAAGFQLHVYDSSGCVLVETDGRGRTLISGLALEAPFDPIDFHGHELTEERATVRFEILPLQTALESCRYEDYEGFDHDRVAATLAQLIGGANAAHCDNVTSVKTLICHEPLTAPGGCDLYFEWPARDRPEPEAYDW